MGSMKKNSPLPPKPHESGAALIVMVLLALLVLAGLVIVSTNLALGSRRSTTEQKAILPAQLAAESGVAYAKAKLQTSYNLLSRAKIIDDSLNIGQMNSLIASICGTSSSAVPVPGYVPATAPTVPVPGTRFGSPNSALVCNLNGTSLTTDQVKFFSRVTMADASSGLAKVYNDSGISTNDESRNRFFLEAFSPTTDRAFGDANVKSGLYPLALIQTNKDRYRFFFKIAGLDSVGIKNGSTRKISIAGNDDVGMIEFTFSPNPGQHEERVPVNTTETQTQTITTTTTTPPNFSNYGAFYNTWTTGVGSLMAENNFSGKFHSNTPTYFVNSTPPASQKSTLSSHSSAFDGEFSSSGCATVTSSEDSDGNRVDSCSSSKNYGNYNGSKYDADTTFLKDSKTSAETINGVRQDYDVYKNNNTALLIKKGNPKPNFRADFVQMPVNDTSQAGLATTNGITLGDTLKVQLSVIGSGDTGTQVISITDTNKVTTVLSYGKDGKMYVGTGASKLPAIKVSGSPGWKAGNKNDTPGTFNGMIYSTGTIASLTGPVRTNYSDPNTASPAIASFSNINVTAVGDVRVTGDIKYETRCMTLTACSKKTDGKSYDVKNIFGLYSVKGDILNVINGSVGNVQDTDAASVGDTNLNSPPDLNVDGFVMSAKGSIEGAAVSNGKFYKGYVIKCNTCQRGKWNIYGGTVQNAMATTYNGDYGYKENFFYDNRGLDYSPIGFPTVLNGTPVTTTTTTTIEVPVTKYNTVMVDDPITSSTPIHLYTQNMARLNPDNGAIVLDSAGIPVSPDFTLNNEVRQSTVKK